MDSRMTQHSSIVERVLSDYAAFLSGDDQVQVELVFDREQGRYLLVEVGWEEGRRIYGTLLHIDLVGDKIWIQQDGTEDGVAEELVAAGVPKHQIVLGFKSPERRQLTEFAVS
ncbi:MAG: XisI protein [Elainella sp.]